MTRALLLSPSLSPLSPQSPPPPPLYLIPRARCTYTIAFNQVPITLPLHPAPLYHPVVVTFFGDFHLSIFTCVYTNESFDTAIKIEDLCLPGATGALLRAMVSGSQIFLMAYGFLSGSFFSDLFCSLVLCHRLFLFSTGVMFGCSLVYLFHLF